MTSFGTRKRSNTITSAQVFHTLPKVDLQQSINDFEDKSDCDDSTSNASTNLSLFSVISKEQRQKIQYGKIGHYSPYERFTNRSCCKTLKEFSYLITLILHDYSQYVFFTFIRIKILKY